MAKNEWVEWIKCNIFEIVILILVLFLVINVFSTGKATIEIQEKENDVFAVEEQMEPVSEHIVEELPPEEPVEEVPPEEGVPEEQTE